MENTIHINGLEVHAYHGVNEPEKIQGQRFYLNVILYLDYQNTISSSNIDNTVHYGQVGQNIIDFFKQNRCDLIETITHKLITMLFEKYHLVTKIDLEVVKPWAPLKFSFENVKTRVIEKKTTVYIALGGNIGNTQSYFKEAINLISDMQGVYDLRQSKIYKSSPFGDVKQADFYNMAIAIETNIHPNRLLKKLKQIEQTLDRQKTLRWGPRTIDLDIILYGNDIVCTPELAIPHKMMAKRDFVLKPLLDLNCNLIDPRTKAYLSDIYESLDDIYIKEV